MAVASAGLRVNRRIPSRSGCGGVTAVTVPSAATWQVVPAGQVPSRTAVMPVRRPVSRMPASRPAGHCSPEVISVTPGPLASGAGPGSGRSPVLCAARVRARVRVRLSRSPRASSRVAGTARPGIAAGSVPGSSRAASAAGMIAAGSPAWPGGAWASRLARIARAAGPGAGAGQAEAAESGDVDGSLAAVGTDTERDRAGLPGGPGRGRYRRRQAAGVRAGRGGGAVRVARPGLASCGPGPGSAAGGFPVSGPAAGVRDRAARRRAPMASGSGGEPGGGLPGGPRRGRYRRRRWTAASASAAAIMTATAIPASAPDGSRTATWPGCAPRDGVLPRRGRSPALGRPGGPGGRSGRAAAAGCCGPGAARVRGGAAAAGLGDQQHPAGLDQGGVGEGTAAGLGPALVEAEDLLPVPGVAEEPGGDVPQVIAVLDAVGPRAARRCPRAGRATPARRL